MARPCLAPSDELPYHNGVNVRLASPGSALRTITVVSGHKKELKGAEMRLV